MFSLLAVLSVTGSTCGVASIAYLVVDRKRFQFFRGNAGRDFSRGFEVGRWLVGADLALLLSNMIYPWLLAALSGPSAVATFSTALAITNVPRMFLICAQNLIMPQSAHTWVAEGRAGLRRLVRRSTALLAGGCLVFCGAMLIAGPWLPGLIYGDKFKGGGNLVFVLSLTILSTAFVLAPTCALTAARRADLNLRINVLAFAVHLTAGLVLVRSYGAIGAAYGLLLGNSVAIVVRWLVYRRVLPAEPESGTI
jgi:O-antigen/teichoic acid export membrane protein